MRRIARTYKYFSQYLLAYGFGARTVPAKEGNSCNLFSMTGDFSDPFVESEEEIVNSYQGTIKSVQLALPILFRDMLRFVCDLANLELSAFKVSRKIKNYYVLVILMAGTIDDV